MPSSPSEKNKQREFIVRTISLAKAYRHLANEELENSHLSHSTALIVNLLAHRVADCSQKYLADQLDVAPASLVPLLKQMEASGLIKRHNDPDDRRINNITISSKGLALADEALRVLDRLRSKLFAGCNPEDIAAANRVVESVQANISRYKMHER